MLDQDVQDLEQIEISIENAKKMVEFAEAVERLENNADFKKVIKEEYLKTNILRLVQLQASPNCQDEAQQKYIQNQLNAAGQFVQYLHYLHMQGQTAKDALLRDTEERERILA